jgi:glutathione S-transferase
MPRPDLAGLGISYRRIPVLAIGHHVYCDSRLILQVLQERYPLHRIPMSGSDKAIQRLLQDWMNDQIFSHATNCLPFERSPTASNSAFLDDRSEAFGRPFRIEDMIKKRPESYGYIRAMFQTLESFLEDGRDWIIGSAKPSVADIDAVYIAQWIVTNPLMDGVTPEDFISEKLFPRTYAWVHRFKQSVEDAGNGAHVPQALSGKEAFDKITSAPETGLEGDISDTDPLNLKIGQMVEIWPTDWASNHKDRGELAMLAANQVCIRNAQGVLVHFPRWNFRIQAVEADVASTSAPMVDALHN